MAAGQRSRERVREIDKMIKKEYPEKGSGYVSEKLGEPESYIKHRAVYLKVRYRKPNKSLLKASEHRESQKKSGKVEVLTKRVFELEQAFHREKSLKEAAQANLIRLTHINHKLKKQLGIKTGFDQM